MKIQINGNWRVRPRQDGLELVAPEHNIMLELSDLAFRNELAAVLTGEKEIPTTNKAIEKTLQQLEDAGTISRVREPAYQNSSYSQKKQATWRIRRNFVGPRGPVKSVY